MPKPGKDEDEKTFVSRCIPEVMNDGTTDDNKQASAICYSMWEQHMKNPKGNVSIAELERVLHDSVLKRCSGC